MDKVNENSRPAVNILIVDDSPEDIAIYKRCLDSASDLKCKVTTVSMGEKALELCRKEAFDCVLLDYDLPDINGLEILSSLKGHYSGSVVMMTGRGNEMVAVRAMREGAHEYLVKDNLTSESLYLAVKTALKIVECQRERQKAEERIKTHVKHLKESNERLKDFAFVVAHELQEPLRKVVAFGDRLRKLDPDISEDGQDCLERMRKSTTKMQSYITGLLEFSKVDRIKEPYQPLNLVDVVKEVLSDLEDRIERSKGTVNIGDLPTLEAHPFQMSTLFKNLIANALKFYKEGVPPVVNITSSRDSEGNYLIRVEDNGLGFETKDADRIFELFERLHSPGKYDGSGVGLAMCKKIATFYKGRIAVESEVGKGSIFTVTIPEKPI